MTRHIMLNVFVEVAAVSGRHKKHYRPRNHPQKVSKQQRDEKGGGKETRKSGEQR